LDGVGAAAVHVAFELHVEGDGGVGHPRQGAAHDVQELRAFGGAEQLHGAQGADDLDVRQREDRRVGAGHIDTEGLPDVQDLVDGHARPGGQIECAETVGGLEDQVGAEADQGAVGLGLGDLAGRGPERAQHGEQLGGGCAGLRRRGIGHGPSMAPPKRPARRSMRRHAPYSGPTLATAVTGGSTTAP
jgi:hypothetical protein